MSSLKIAEAIYLRITSAVHSVAVPRLAWHSVEFPQAECPPLLLLSKVSPGDRSGSTRRGRFSDEPFRVRDIQFHGPEIFVEPCPLREEISNCEGTWRFGRPGTLPDIPQVERQNALQTGEMPPTATDQKENGSAIRVALSKHGAESAGRLRPTQQPRNFDVRRKPFEAQFGRLKPRRARPHRSALRPARRGCGPRAFSPASRRCGWPC